MKNIDKMQKEALDENPGVFPEHPNYGTTQSFPLSFPVSVALTSP